MDPVEVIITKDQLTQEEMQHVVEQYIFEKKQVKVKIDIENHPLTKLVSPNMARPLLERELYLLNEAYNVACEYFFEKLKNEKINEPKENP